MVLSSVIPLSCMAQATLEDTQSSNSSPVPIPKESPEQAAERMSHRASLANERISASAPESDVPLGSPIDIDVTFAPGQIAEMHVAQFQPHGPVNGGIEQSEDVFQIVREEGQTKTIEVVPMQLGSVDLHIGAVYADNASAQQTIKLNVVPSSKGLKKFSLNEWSDAKGWGALVLVLEDEEKDRQDDRPRRNALLSSREIGNRPGGAGYRHRPTGCNDIVLRAGNIADHHQRRLGGLDVPATGTHWLRPRGRVAAGCTHAAHHIEYQGFPLPPNDPDARLTQFSTTLPSRTLSRRLVRTVASICRS